MNGIKQLLQQEGQSRERIIATTSGLCIVVNLLIALAKVSIGLLASSIAIVSEGVNNATDALASVMTLVGTKLAGKHPDKQHPFGYHRLEYLTSLVIAVLILVSGIEMLISSVKLIFNPAELSISYISLIIVAVSAVVKYALGAYTLGMGKKADSGALEAVGIESKNDSFVSLVTILSAIVFLVFQVSIDAYVGVFTSLLIIKAGFEVLMDTVSELLGRPGEAELADRLYAEIRQTDGILNAADMMLHNYGPNAYSGSVNVEIDHSKTVGNAYEFLHQLQLRIMHDYHVVMVFGIYAVDNDRETSKALRKTIAQFVQQQAHVLSYHAVYLAPDGHTLYCDLVVDYDLRNWDGLRRDFRAYMAQKYPGLDLELTIETEFV